MKETPILMSAPMVRAILDDRKTQTRRIAKRLSPCMNEGEESGWCPYGRQGDRLWVKETFCPVNTSQSLNRYTLPQNRAAVKFEFAADHPEDHCPRERPWGGQLGVELNWTPSIFMPRWASRITLEIVSIRMEWLQDISEEDAIAEGVECVEVKVLGWNSQKAKGGYGELDEKVPPLAVYRMLWESINGKGSWNENPWVWVIEFKRL